MKYEPIDLEILTEICRRSVDGEGVSPIIRSMGLDLDKTLGGLKEHHHKEIKDATIAQRQRIANA